MKATALKPPEQSMNAEQNKDDRRHYSAKEAAALMRQVFPPHPIFRINK